MYTDRLSWRETFQRVLPMPNEILAVTKIDINDHFPKKLGQSTYSTQVVS